MTVTIEYKAANATLFSSQPYYLVEVVPPVDPVNPVGQVLNGLVVNPLVNGQYLLSFQVSDFATYYVQYRDNVNDPWSTVLMPIFGQPGRIIWLDTGAPKKIPDPTATNTRQFQIIRVQ